MVIMTITFLAVVVAIFAYDWYQYNHVKPRYTPEEVRGHLDEIEKEVELNEENKDYPLKTAIDIWDFWDSEMLRIKNWNKRHPEDAV